MQTESVENSSTQPGSFRLLSNVLGSARKLVELEVALVRAEVKENSQKAKQSMRVLALAALAFFPAVVLIAFAISEELSARFGWSLASCHLFVALWLSLLGGALLFRFRDIWIDEEGK